MRVYKKTSIEERFWAKVEKGDGCWTWTGCKSPKGYGQILFNDNKIHLAHRVSYIMANGLIDSSLLVRHKCDNPSCVNPDHLELGTYKDNNRDKIERGRDPRKNQTHCLRGHEYTLENTLIQRGGEGRQCRECHKAAMLKYLAKKKESKLCKAA